MSASLFGTAVGTCIGALLSFGAWNAARKHLRQHPGAIAIYPTPDWVGYAKTATPLLGILVFFHYLPVIAVKLYPLLLGKQLVISERGYEAVLFLAHAMAFIGLSLVYCGRHSKTSVKARVLAALGQAATPNPSLERTTTGKALGPRGGQGISSASRPKRLAGGVRSAQTLGVLQAKECPLNRSERASQIWAVLAWAAKNRQTLTYSQVGKLIGVPTAGLGQLLEPIQSYCLINRLPPLTVLVVQQDSGLPGSGFIGATASEFARAQADTFAKDWLEHGNPQPEKLEAAVRERPSNGPQDA